MSAKSDAIHLTLPKDKSRSKPKEKKPRDRSMLFLAIFQGLVCIWNVFTFLNSHWVANLVSALAVSVSSQDYFKSWISGARREDWNLQFKVLIVITLIAVPLALLEVKL